MGSGAWLMDLGRLSHRRLAGGRVGSSGVCWAVVWRAKQTRSLYPKGRSGTEGRKRARLSLWSQLSEAGLGAVGSGGSPVPGRGSVLSLCNCWQGTTHCQVWPEEFVMNQSTEVWNRLTVQNNPKKSQSSFYRVALTPSYLPPWPPEYFFLISRERG